MTEISVVISLSPKQSEPSARLLSSLKRQSLVPIEVLTVAANTPNRHVRFLAAAKGELIYFLDDDTELPSRHHLRSLARAAKLYPRFAALGGAYLNSRDASYLDRSYHSLCKAWILASQNNTDSVAMPKAVANLLGGNLAIRRSSLKNFSPSWAGPLWGGEDTHFLRALSEQGHLFGFFPQLSVRHYPSSSLSHWGRRAWLHGRHRRQFSLKTHQQRLAMKWLALVPVAHWPALSLHAVTVLFADFLASSFLASLRSKPKVRSQGNATPHRRYRRSQRSSTH